jgi:hypothetical protein
MGSLAVAITTASGSQPRGLLYIVVGAGLMLALRLGKMLARTLRQRLREGTVRVSDGRSVAVCIEENRICLVRLRFWIRFGCLTLILSCRPGRKCRFLIQLGRFRLFVSL